MMTLKQVYVICLLMGICSYYWCSGQELSKRKTVILIDPGHGGIDSGAIGVYGNKEKDIVLEIALEALHWNEILLKNKYDIYLTRYSDTLISLSHRSKLATVLHPDLFISLHGNHAKNSSAKGIEVYLHPGVNPTDQNGKHSIRMAAYIIKHLAEKLGYRTRGIKKANFQVLRQNINTCPSVLIELGFLSNKDEANYLKNKKNKKAIALAILLAIKI